MEARFARAIPIMALALVSQLVVGMPAANAAGYKTTNFVVTAPTPALAKEIGDSAEMWRQKLAIEWLGQEIPSWSRPCPIDVRVGSNMGAGGATSFVFDRGEVFDWKMNIQGSRERILDSVLPHEVTHTIFATHFRQPLPRWADEGACTTVEHRSEVAKQERMLIDFLKNRRGIPFNQMFAMKDYPSDVMPLYSQGHSVAQWLIESRGRQEFLGFLNDGLQDENWQRAVNEHYGFENLAAMQNSWLNWVKDGRPQLSPSSGPMGQLASNTQGTGNPSAAAIYRGQSPDDIRPIAATASPNQPWVGVRSSETVSSQSVYATAATRAKAQREREAGTASAVHDASRHTGTMLR
jgi:hypothetical protein